MESWPQAPRHRCWLSRFAPALWSTALVAGGGTRHSGCPTGVCGYPTLSAVGNDAPSRSAARCYRRAHFPQGWPSSPLGTVIQQLELAKTLGAIAREPRSFYEGWIARAIAEFMAQQGGKITLEDLRTYTPVWREPICGTYRAFQVCSMPPPLLVALPLCKCSTSGNCCPLLLPPAIAVTT